MNIHHGEVNVRVGEGRLGRGDQGRELFCGGLPGVPVPVVEPRGKWKSFSSQGGRGGAESDFSQTLRSDMHWLWGDCLLGFRSWYWLGLESQRNDERRSGGERVKW